MNSQVSEFQRLPGRHACCQLKIWDDIPHSAPDVCPQPGGLDQFGFSRGVMNYSNFCVGNTGPSASRTESGMVWWRAFRDDHSALFN